MEPGKGLQKDIEGVFAVGPQGKTVVVNIEVDMLAHNRFVHFPGVVFYVVREGGVMREGIFEAFADEAVDPGGKCGVRDVAAEDDAAEGDGCPCLFLPEFAQVEDLYQAFLLIGETVLMDDHAAVDRSGEDGV